MRRFFLVLFFWVGLVGASSRTQAFSLHGTTPAWFTDQTGQFPNGDIYGPVNLGEEYRWNVPILNYSFDESFINYFGQDGVDEVEKAIAIINSLPPMSQVDLSQYPLFSQRVNRRASDLLMFDLKSYALKAILEQLGLGSPTRFVFQSRIREAQTTPPVTNYLIVQRNFDPETWAPTPYINGQLWTYNDIFDNQDSPSVKSGTITEPVDPLILAEPVASLVPGLGFTVFGFGSYFTGLTRDDVGGLRYIYRPDNRNVDTLPADAVGTAGFGGGAIGGSGEWTPIPTPSTNAPAGGGGGVVTTNGVFFPQAIRGGVDKLTFVRSPGLFQPTAYLVTNRFTETIQAVITNGVQRTVSQRVTRFVAAPDFVFSAEDLTQDPNAAVAILDRNAVGTNNDGINGTVALDGPGQFSGSANISFSKTGPVLLNTAPTFLAQPGISQDFIWGSFDGSTNDPIVYPTGTSIRDIERQIFGSR
ncbi:MAG: hypothetical protein AB7O66_23515 [Limisphaerales bacterium]